MNKKHSSMKYYPLIGIACLLILAGVSCLPTFRTPASAPVIQTVEVDREVTRQVMVEVTRIVEIPVTLAPTLTPFLTSTPTRLPSIAATLTRGPSPTSALTPVPAAVTVQVRTQCLYGPSAVYLNKYDLLADSQQSAIGRNQDSSWLLVQGADHKNSCWVKASILKVNSGNLTNLWVLGPVLSPYSPLYTPPQAVSTFRSGKDVTIFWQPISMSEADYHGYLIEAWVCQGGKLVFNPLSYETSFDQNSSMLALKVADEGGCLEPSSARIYTVDNQGYSPWKQVPWQAWPTATPKP
ncbi:MAG TPA: hypothetical protein VF326_11275 [Anaerolineaceae bacterium]